MRFLLFGTATDDPKHPDPAGASFRAIKEALAAHAGEPVDARFVWAFPLPTLADHVRRRLQAFDPDVVIVHCAGYSVSTPTIGARMASLLEGRAYPILNRIRKVAHFVFAINTEDTEESHRHTYGARQRLYGKVRDALVGMGLGRCMVDVRTAAASYDAAIRALTASENLVVLVRGPTFSEQWLGESSRLSGSLRRQAIERVEMLDRAVAESCVDLRVPYLPQVGTEHGTAEGQAREAEDELKTLLPLLASYR